MPEDGSGEETESDVDAVRRGGAKAVSWHLDRVKPFFFVKVEDIVIYLGTGRRQQIRSACHTVYSSVVLGRWEVASWKLLA